MVLFLGVHNSTFDVNTKITKTISGLTQNKPVYLVWKNNSTSKYVSATITSGTALVTNDGSYVSAFGTAAKSSVQFKVVIPTSTSIVVCFAPSESGTISTSLIAYQ